MEAGTNLLTVLVQAGAALRQADVPFCLVGGLAVAILAKPRATEDVDIALAAREQDIARLGPLLRAHLQVVQDTTVIRLSNVTIWRVLVKPDMNEPETMVVLDFLLADRPEIARAIRRALPIKVGADEIPVARIDDLMALKKLSGRPQDLLDLDSLKDVDRS